MVRFSCWRCPDLASEGLVSTKTGPNLTAANTRLAVLFQGQEDDWNKRKFSAANMIFSAMDFSIQTLFQAVKTDPNALRDAAKEPFAEKGFTYLHNSVISLASLRLSETHDIEDNCMRFKTLQHQLAFLRSERLKEWYNSLFIDGLGTKFEI